MQLAFEGMPAPPMESVAMVIPSVFHNQTDMLRAIMHLYGPIDADFTYSEGVFWRDLPQPWVRSDLMPTGNVVADFTALPFKSRSLQSIMLDPPFIHGTSPDVTNGIMQLWYSSYRTQAALRVSYHGAIAEAYRVLKSGGYLHLKCQDVVEHDRQEMTHCHVWDMATRLGFDVVDLFILIAACRMTDGGTQAHARKYHSYVWSFRKPNRHLRSAA
jgi:hypothetical protein